MKKTLIILFLALSIVGRGQTFSTLLHDKQKVFNVLDYGAVSGDAITLTYNKTFDYWIEISRSNN